MVKRASSSEVDRKQQGRSCPESAVRSEQHQAARRRVSREQERARCRMAWRTPEQGKVHQVAKRVLNCQEDAESQGRQIITKKVPSDQEDLRQTEGHRVARGCCIAS